jgi:aminoglycoside phosphotransferase (APT) family kinase protein
MDREFFILNELYLVKYPVPKPILLCQDKEILGSEFYLMEYVEGRIFREPYMSASNPKERKILYEEMNKTIALLHNIDISKTKLQELTS